LKASLLELERSNDSNLSLNQSIQSNESINQSNESINQSNDELGFIWDLLHDEERAIVVERLIEWLWLD